MRPSPPRSRDAKLDVPVTPSMLQPDPKRDILFSLVPLNQLSVDVLKDTDNRHHVAAINAGDDVSREVLHVGFTTSSAKYTLATIGRQGDIVVRAPNISRVQLSFELVETTFEVMAYDRSSNQSTAFLGPQAMSFRPGQTTRRVLMDRQINLELGFGGHDARQFRFRIMWHDPPPLTITQALAFREDSPRQARTLEDDTPGVTMPECTTRVRDISSGAQMRFSNRALLGNGGFGVVFEAVDVESGKVFAVKRIKRPDVGTHRYTLLQREVNALRGLCHPHIVALRGAQWSNSHFELIMDVQGGSVDDLAADGIYTSKPTLCDGLLHQMLQALDYLARQGIIHRDVKPDNILFKRDSSEKYLYQLADFGLANSAEKAKSFAGTRKFMAPELAMESYRHKKQTPKIDIWSLFATLVDVLNVAKFRETEYAAVEAGINAVHDAATKHPDLKKIGGMGTIDPEHRARARDILNEFFEGRDGAMKKPELHVGTGKAAKHIPNIATTNYVKPAADRIIRKRGKRKRNGLRPGLEKMLEIAGAEALPLRIPGAFSSVQL
ncbi:hypothetical protein Purlil1_13458 [Purpureocillium lilacinum]|uniref:mitogen-activated protein kinase n=1 Tax=Purpureocillium lilacinum TaxID=33203 RepID=A0ABR0BE11_PURLI|nr:hypothetical protein Purlil1_13458 [Purpureocillium lilacinum]